MAWFAKKSVVIEAVLQREDNWPEVVEFLKKSGDRNDFSARFPFQVGKWIIRDEHGDLYPCRPDIFAETYESVAPPSQKEKHDD